MDPRLRGDDGVWQFLRHPDLAVLALAVAAAYALNAWLVWRVPPNNYDSMMYHLSRVGYWLQQGSFYPPWNLRAVFQTAYPMNAELGLLWTIALWGSDRLAGGVQWIAALAAMVAIAGCARTLGAARPAALGAALLWATLPQTVLQSTSTQNDLVVSAFFLTAAYGLLLGIRCGDRNALLLSALALGLALGTKTTAQMALPGFALMAALAWWRSGRPARDARYWAIAGLAAWAGLGLHVPIMNWVYYESPFGPEWFMANLSTRAILTPVVLAETLAKFAYQLVDPGALPGPLANQWLQLKATIGQSVFAALGLEPNRRPETGLFWAFDFRTPSTVQESESWLGPLGALLALIVVIDTVRSAFRRDTDRLLLSATAMGFVLVLAATLRWQPWGGRYFLLAATLCAPLAGRYLEPARCPAALRWAIVSVALFVLAVTATHNQSKALIGPYALWSRDRIALQAAQWPVIEPLLRIVEREVPADARIGTVIPPSEWDYPLFGPRFTRTVIPLVESNAVTPESCAAQRLAFLLVSASEQQRVAPAVFEGRRTWQVDRWTLVDLAP